MDELIQQQRFELAFKELIKNEKSFLAQWNGRVDFLPNQKTPTAPIHLLSARTQDKLVSLLNKLRNKRF